jgi:hypothetical protein
MDMEIRFIPTATRKKKRLSDALKKGPGIVRLKWGESGLRYIAFPCFSQPLTCFTALLCHLSGYFIPCGMKSERGWICSTWRHLK